MKFFTTIKKRTNRVYNDFYIDYDFLKELIIEHQVVPYDIFLEAVQ